MRVLAFLCLAVFASAQQAKFEVVSIKPAAPGGDGRGLARFSGGTLTMEDYPVRGMIRAAYGLKTFELVGGPSWIASTRYEITAKAPRAASGPELWRMVQPLLEERFGLRTHREKREFSVYSLVLATPGKLTAAREGSCFGSDPKAAPQPSGRGIVLPCGSIGMPQIHGGVQLVGGKIGMPRLALYLTDLLDRPVVDKTGYAGTFDLQLKFALDHTINPALQRRVLEDDPEPGQASDPSRFPGLPAALRDQLGLKLQPAKAFLDVTVIDRIERPAAN